MATDDIPEDLIALEHSAWMEIQEGQLTVETAEAVRARIVELAAGNPQRRREIEEAVKRLVRHPEPEDG
ncbi:hypothetical protein OG709_35705 (plasmid) [Streptomyces sp. NBC_01267]|uniref:hypothetical protein n=1 Tax=Streptomyces sp. NBC_01267 TaxID=2903805 RepID=UPI002E313569|nr:hypothetical protein [Streptomyces sp. NBC_01267]